MRFYTLVRVIYFPHYICNDSYNPRLQEAESSEKEHRKSENHNCKIDSNKHIGMSSNFHEFVHNPIEIVIVVVIEIKYLFKM